MHLSQRTEGRLSRIIDIVYYLILLVGFYMFMRYAFWLTFPFLFSFVVAITLQKPMEFAHRKLKLKKGFTAIVMVLLFYVLILIIIGLIGVRLWTWGRGFVEYLTSLLKNLPELMKSMQLRINELSTWLPDSMEVSLNNWLAGFTDSIIAGENAKGESVGMFGSLMSRINLEWFKAPVTGMLTAAGKLPTLALTVVITIVSSFFMTIGYEDVVNFIKRQLGERKNTLSTAKRIVFSSLRRLMRSYLIIIGITFCELLLGLLLFRLIGVYDGKYLLGIALAISLVDILPVLGVGSILTPWAIYCLIMGQVGLGVGLLVMYVVILVVRQVIEPKLVAANLGLPPILTIAGMYIGLQLFGFLGLLIMPLLLILLKLLNDEGVFHLWKSSAEEAEEGEAPEEAVPAAEEETAE